VSGHRWIQARWSRLLLALGIAAGLYFLVYRPLQLDWGASRGEIDGALPGDEVVGAPSFVATRAVTVRAPAERIWPWLVQMGHTRAGWYSYDLVDNLARASAGSILNQFQDLRPGDLVPVSPDGQAGFRVKAMGEPHWMLWGDDADRLSWVWSLQPAEDGTRLITRVRLRYTWRWPAILMELALDAGDFPMMRQCMLGIRDRAEGRPPASLAAQSAELGLWLLAFAGFLIAEAALVWSRRWLRFLAVALGAGALTILVVMLKPPLWIDAAAALAIGAALVAARGRGPGAANEPLEKGRAPGLAV